MLFTLGYTTVGWQNIISLIKNRLDLSGIYNISSIHISKYHYLIKLSDALNSMLIFKIKN